MDDWVMGDDWTYCNPDTGEPGFQGIRVNQVPSPGAVYLLGSGLLGLFGLSRRRGSDLPAPQVGPSVTVSSLWDKRFRVIS
jgi:hypothetical protein